MMSFQVRVVSRGNSKGINIFIRNFYEKELKRIVSKYGNIAQVWSAFEIRTDIDIESNIRGLNSIKLHYENGRWWIDSWTCEMESQKSSLVTEFLTIE